MDFYIEREREREIDLQSSHAWERVPPTRVGCLEWDSTKRVCWRSQGGLSPSMLQGLYLWKLVLKFIATLFFFPPLLNKIIIAYVFQSWKLELFGSAKLTIAFFLYFKGNKLVFTFYWCKWSVIFAFNYFSLEYC